MAKKGRKLFRKNLKSLELRQGWAGPERIRVRFWTRVGGYVHPDSKV